MKLLLIAIPLLILPVIFNGGIVFGADFNTMGDVGCKTAAKDNLKNLAGKSISFFGIGDIVYKCSTSSISSLWSQVNSRKTALGNHECESGQGKSFVSSSFGTSASCSKGYGGYVRGGDTGVLLLNQYTSYKPESAQHKYVVNKINEWKNKPNITNIVAIFHELIEPVNCSGSHCHGLEKPAFKTAYNQIFKDNRVFIIQAHTHLTAFGVVDGKRTAVCGGGGEDGTSLNGLGKYTFVSNKMGYCNFHFDANKVVVKFIGTDRKVIQEHTWNN